MITVYKKDSSANGVTIAGGVLGSVTINTQGASVLFQYDGTNWFRLR